MPALKLHYFGLPGRGETARLCLTVGGIPFEDVVYEFSTWPASKAKMPFGQMPVLEVGEKMLAQSGAIERYTAKLAGLYPEDPLEAAEVDQAMFLMSDFFELFTPTFRLKAEEKVAARLAILEGKGKDMLGHISKLLASGGYIAGGKLSLGDIAVYVSLSNLVSGFMDGVPKDLLDGYPVIKAFHNKIASEPAIKAYYETRGEGYRAAFKPSA
ncbi:Hematopoietic prostaglandin D synthase [Tetrabaena socialis]|uniref:Hematopoietic prostaglandin D synthase n=1 Tax=Tetrabaena socialis TaxID=47790 RepID=A0A2J7ZU59_9CHLO|nr:Hematopoietic prostaglandin D synthase [Tetrabaena socialis]|eukprot:PNH03804.1 Hematopoietic prostaglandin D synthase [Tetrabaena socialis]